MESAITKEKSINEKMKYNVRLYTKYRMVGYDVLFYYAISILYFTIAKGLSMTEVVFLSSVYTLSVAIWQLFSNLFVEKIGIKKSIVLGNFFACMMVVLYLIGPNFWILALANVIGALGFSLKSIGESTLLFESVSILKRPSLFTKFEGIGNSRYFYLDAILSVVAGYLFLVSPYLPMILCLICMASALVISTKFYPTYNHSVKHIKIKEYVKGLKAVVSSSRARSLLFFAFFIAGMVSANTTLYKAVILDFNITSDVLAYIVCIFTIVIGIGSKYAKNLEKELKNKTLIFILVVLCSMLAVIGLVGLTVTYSFAKIAVIVLCLCVMGIMIGAYRVLIRKYITSFTTENVRTKIASLYSMAENLGGTVLLFIAGIILTTYTNAFTAVAISCLVLFIGIMIYKYADKRLGLKPEQYKPEEINYIDINSKM